MKALALACRWRSGSGPQPAAEQSDGEHLDRMRGGSARYPTRYAPITDNQHVAAIDGAGAASDPVYRRESASVRTSGASGTGGGGGDGLVH